MVIAVAPKAAEETVVAFQAYPLGQQRVMIGQITAEHPERVVLRTIVGAQRGIETLIGDQFPRIS